MAKNTCEDFPALRVRHLKESGYLERNYRSGTIIWAHSGMKNDRSVDIVSCVDEYDARLYLYSVNTDSDGAKVALEYNVRLVSTPCHFGGKRYWFACPLVWSGTPCQRRVGVLYGVGKYYGCRRCYNLAYRSQQATHTGWRGAFNRTVFSGIYEKEEALRIKYWRKAPTKRYRRLLRKMSRLSNTDLIATVSNRLSSSSKKELSKVL